MTTCPTKINDFPFRTTIDHHCRLRILPVHIIRIKRRCNGLIHVLNTKIMPIWICTRIKTWWCNGIILRIKHHLHRHRAHIPQFTIHCNHLHHPCHLTGHQSPHHHLHHHIIRAYSVGIWPAICAEGLQTIHCVQMLQGKIFASLSKWVKDNCLMNNYLRNMYTNSMRDAQSHNFQFTHCGRLSQSWHLLQVCTWTYNIVVLQNVLLTALDRMKISLF